MIAGCSSRPVEPRYLTRDQVYARHLNALRKVAEEKAVKVSETMAVYDYLDNVPIFVSLPDQTNFSQHYRQFLQTAVAQKGFRVSETQEEQLVLSFSLQDRHILTTRLSFDNKILMIDSQVFDAGPPTLSREAADAVWLQYSRRKPAYIR